MKAVINACVICDDNGWEVPTSTGRVSCAHDSGYGTLEGMCPQCMCTRSRGAALGSVFGLWIGKDCDTPMAHLMLRFKSCSSSQVKQFSYSFECDIVLCSRFTWTTS
jgi:hypothetical protein